MELMGPWVPYIPDVIQDEPVSSRKRGRRFVSPLQGDAFFVYGEFDDGNGMWIVTGVSPAN